MNQLKGMINYSIRVPPEYIIVSSGKQQPNHAHYLWVCIDQLVWAWSFTTISKDTLIKARDVQHYLDI